MRKRVVVVTVLSMFLILSSLTQAYSKDAAAIVDDAVAYMRGKTSVCTAKMTIHRPGWERSMTYKTWTKGSYETVMHILTPKEDFGNGILKKNGRMWNYNPKINRTVKVPPSMMTQSYMGSDFSNNDLSKDEDVFNFYTHAIIGTATDNNQKVYIIESLPKVDAPVVWGMIKLHIREDNIFLKEEFYDEDHKLVKSLINSNIKEIGGKMFPMTAKMQQVHADHYTVAELQEAVFDKEVENRLFSLSNLQNPGGE